MTHICASKKNIIGSDNDLSTRQYKASTWTNDGILLILPLGTNLNEILIKIQNFFIHENASNADDNFKCIFSKENDRIPIQI